MDSLTPLTETDLRGLVRDAIARARSGGPASPGASGAASPPSSDAAVTVHVHASQALFMLGPGGDADGNCIIEPAVRCTHCGYCRTFGH